MEMKMDAASMFENAGINTYCDFVNKKYYTKMNIKGQEYIVKTEDDTEAVYK